MTFDYDKCVWRVPKRIFDFAKCMYVLESECDCQRKEKRQFEISIILQEEDKFKTLCSSLTHGHGHGDQVKRDVSIPLQVFFFSFLCFNSCYNIATNSSKCHVGITYRSSFKNVFIRP